jgi:predicted phage terminase large subunit-like protein
VSLRPNPSTVVREAQALVERARSARCTPAQAAARQWSLAEFTRQAWRVIEPGTPLVWNWTLEAICRHTEAALTGALPQQNLAVTVPPGFAKSSITSVMAPSWDLVTRPWRRWICASATPNVSIRDSLRCRELVDSGWYRSTFGTTWRLADDNNLKTNFSTSSGGFRLALGTGANITGTRGDVLLLDDPLDAADAFSKAERERVKFWFDHGFSNRLADMRRGVRIVIGQRLHVDDPIGHAVATEPTAWCQLSIKQCFVPEQRCVTPIWQDPRTTEGELAFPERFPRSVIDGERLRLGRAGFAAQHQQEPFVEGGELFLRTALQLWDPRTALPAFARTIISADTAFQTSEQADYSALAVIGQFPQGYFVLDVVRRRLAYPALKATLTELTAKWTPDAVVIEDAASGQSLLQDLRQSTVLPIVGVKPAGDKLTRAHTVIPTWEAGRCFALASAPWLPDFLDELAAFPKAPHDDQVDALTMGLKYLIGGGANSFLTWLAAANAKDATRPAALLDRPGVRVVDLTAEGNH